MEMIVIARFNFLLTMRHINYAKPLKLLCFKKNGHLNSFR